MPDRSASASKDVAARAPKYDPDQTADSDPSAGEEPSDPQTANNAAVAASDLDGEPGPIDRGASTCNNPPSDGGHVDAISPHRPDL